MHVIKARLCFCNSTRSVEGLGVQTEQWCHLRHLKHTKLQKTQPVVVSHHIVLLHCKTLIFTLILSTKDLVTKDSFFARKKVALREAVAAKPSPPFHCSCCQVIAHRRSRGRCCEPNWWHASKWVRVLSSAG